MLREIRNIIFAHNELEEAVRLFHTSVQAILPPGTVVSFEPAVNEEPTLKVNVVAPKEAEVSTITMVPAHVAAAMLHYCIKHGVPVPRKAKKKIEVIEGSLALTLTL